MLLCATPLDTIMHISGLWDQPRRRSGPEVTLDLGERRFEALRDLSDVGFRHDQRGVEGDDVAPCPVCHARARIRHDAVPEASLANARPELHGRIERLLGLAVRDELDPSHEAR